MADLRRGAAISLRGKLLLITLSVLMLGGVAGAGLVLGSYRDSMLDAARSSNEALAATIAEYGAAPLVFEDAEGAVSILDKLQSNHEVVRATLLSEAGKVFAHYERKKAARASNAARLIAEKPVVHEGRTIGKLVLEATTAGVEQRIAAIAERIMIGIALLIALCALLALRLQLFITGPLQRLASAMQRVGAQGELGARERYQGTDEIAVLYERFNDMLDQLEQRGRERDRSQLWLRNLMESLPDQVLVFDAEGHVMDMRGDASQMPHLARGRSIHELMPPDVASAMRGAVARTLEKGEPVRIEYQLGQDGAQHYEAVLTPLDSASAAENWRVLAVARDVTERDRLQSQFQRAQKLDAVGQLAGGIAHDFNNLLAGIVGYAQLIKLGRGGPEAGKEILSISERASDLVKQLLRFSRKDTSRKRATDVNDLVRRVEGILRHTLDPRIQLEVELPIAALTVHGDPSQLESAVLNLAVNARDAMPNGGALTLCARAVPLDELAISALDCELAPGEHVEISVADTGTGIPPELIPHIFEPFFTTKEAGKGTGLGLAAVYGTAQAHRGGVHVRSEPGKGSVFRLFLPRAAEASEKASNSTPPRGSGHLMLVDDEGVVRETARALLMELGYTVEAFARPRDAIAFFEQSHHKIDAVLVDMVMPQLHGAEVVERLRQIQPDVRILIVSGFLGVGDNDPHQLAGLPILRKPFTLQELAQAVHELITQPPNKEAPHAHA
jgi:PAS domain S-box-containing protein